MTESQPKEIGRYKVQEELGRGGFGRVYRAYDPTVGRPVAIKILTDVSADTQTRFRNEAMVAGNLRHKNIVTVYEYGSYEGLPFLAMEYLEGEDLHHILASRKPLTLLEKCAIMSQVADGLCYAHANGVVHRDMKPANIMVLRDGTVKIMDFGIARLTSTPDATRLTQQGYLIGTLRYMAPEQLAGADFDPRCDIFAYGVIFYELLSGSHPFDAPDAQRLMYKLSFEDPRPIHDLVPALPPGLGHAISRMIQKDRDRRYRTVKDLQFDIEPVRFELQKGRASELLQQAQSLFEQKQLEPARTVLQEALALEPSNSAARTLWEALQQQIQQRTLQPRIEAALNAGEEHLGNRRFADAVKAFESALQLDRENVYIQGRLDQARALGDHAKRTFDLLAEARRHFEQQNLTAAYRTVSEALSHDPKNPDAAEFLKTIRGYIEQRHAEQRIDEAVRKAEGLMLIPAYEEAIAVLEAADQESSKVRECLERVRNQSVAYKRQQKLHKEMAAATDLLRKHRLEEAAKCLQGLRAEFPENQEVAQLLAYAQKEQAALARTKVIEGAAAEARSRTGSNEFEAALKALDEALTLYPGESTLVRLLESTMTAKSEWERRRAIESTVAKCESLRAGQRFAEAVQVVERALKDYSSEAALLELLKKLEGELAEHRHKEAVRSAATQAEQFLAQMQPEKAVDVLQQNLKRLPGESVLNELLKRAQLEIRAREEKAAAERAAAIEKRVQEVTARVAAGDFDGAVALLEDGLRKWPGGAQLQELRKSTLQARERHENRRRALQELEEIRRSALQESGSPAIADLLTVATAIAADHPRDQEIQSAAAEPVKLLTAIGLARQRLLNGDFAAALDVCRLSLERYPGHPAFRDFQREAERGQRRAHLMELHRRATATTDLRERAKLFEAGLARYPDETGLADQLQFTRSKLALIDNIVEQARAHERSGEWDLALEKWSTLLAVCDKDPGLDAEIERVRRARDQAAAPRREPHKNDLPGPARPQKANSRKEEGQETRRAVQELLVRAQAAIRTDWRQADALVAEALLLDPNYAVPTALLQALAAHRKAVAEPVAQPLEQPQNKSISRPTQLVAAGVAAVILAGGVVALRSRHTAEDPSSITAKAPRQVVPNDAAPATPPAHAITPTVDAPLADNEKKTTPAVPARMARLEIAGAISGAHVKVDGRLVGDTDGSGELQCDVPPGTHTVELSKDDYAPVTIKQQFRVGKTVRLGRERVTMAKVATPAPPPPDPKQIDSQEWAQIAGNANPDDFDAFIRAHPSSAHLEQARSRAADLRQQMRNRTAQQAQQAEQTAWDKLDQNSRDQLQDYLSRFSSGAHTLQGRARIAELDRQAADALAAQRLKEQKDQEQAWRNADLQAIGKLLADFEAAYNRKDLATMQRLWTGIQADTYRKLFKDAKDLKFELQLMGQPEVNGNSATARCRRTLNFRPQTGATQVSTDRVTLHLSKDGSGWLIRSIQSN